MPQRKILCVASDQTVNRNWCMALAAEGYEVASTARTQHAAQLLRSERFDLLLIGHSFPHLERASLATLAREKHHVPVLLVCALASDPTIPADEYMTASASDESLIEAAAVTLIKAEKGFGQRRSYARAGRAA